jgi:hypothetical protein
VWKRGCHSKPSPIPRNLSLVCSTDVCPSWMQRQVVWSVRTADTLMDAYLVNHSSKVSRWWRRPSKRSWAGRAPKNPSDSTIATCTIIVIIVIIIKSSSSSSSLWPLSSSSCGLSHQTHDIDHTTNIPRRHTTRGKDRQPILTILSTDLCLGERECPWLLIWPRGLP